MDISESTEYLPNLLMSSKRKMGKERRSRNSADVIAATAGKDTWKTWAGRTHGTDDFEWADYFRGAQRKFCRKFLWKPPGPGTPCPICLEEPASADQWHITSSCGHAVCVDCLKGYAASQVRDPDHSGPLKCPTCPLPLREKDAIAALGSDEELLRLWDAKLRDEVLRALPSYRHCPHCEGKDRRGGALGGGGFVTPECLTPINEERERDAQYLLDLIPASNRLLVVAYLAYFYLYSQMHSSSFFVDLLNVLAPLAVIRRLWLLCNMAIARAARRAFFKPIVVECPCCDDAFILNAEAELATGNNHVYDEATEKWIGNNCRPCPSCSAPISKSGGCNHMQCGKCKAHFCWACMRLRTNCAAYNCSNGAPFGEATGADQPMVDEVDGMTIIDRIVQTENLATSLDRRDIVFVVGLLSTILGREYRFVQEGAKMLVVSAACLLSGPAIMGCVLVYILVNMGQNFLHQFLGTNQGRRLHHRGAHGAGDIQLQLNERNEEALVAEAIARSLQEM
uniref:RING-type domain-containing protein n=1 Tax=Pseudictyota dubia TaxID=2749911 RepID=A0A7R9W5N6_9STRA|mmetsp:Transcript_347/g.408  ORF Transcript_347/g.408 Transcript_347/m.408 type:complete len:510 (+) Transcript_347:75-1604(+)